MNIFSTNVNISETYTHVALLHVKDWLQTIKLTDWPSFCKYYIFKYTDVILYFFILIEKNISTIYLTVSSKQLLLKNWLIAHMKKSWWHEKIVRE